MRLKCCIIVPPAYNKVVSVLVYLHPLQRDTLDKEIQVWFVEDFQGCFKISVQGQSEPFREGNAAYKVSAIAVIL